MIRVSMWVRMLPLCALLACSNLGGGGKEEELLPDLIREVKAGDLLEEVSESGKIISNFEVAIKAKVSGEVKEVFAQEGQIVKKGTLLLTLVDHDYQRDLAMARVRVQGAQLELEASELELERKSAALASRGISQAEYEVARTQAEMAKVQLRQAKLELEAAQDRVNYTRITSPIDGTVIVRNVEPGELITAGVTATVNGEAQLTIAQTDTLRLEIELNQVDVSKVQVGQDARVLLDAYPGKEVMGKVTQIAASGRRSSTRDIDIFVVRIEVDPKQSEVAIKPGMTAEVRIIAGKYPNVVKVPVEATFREDDKDYVYIVKEEEGKSVKEKREVTLGHRGGREIEVVSGLAAGEKIYASGDVKDLSLKMD